MIVIYTVGIVGHLTTPLYDLMISLTPFTLLLMGGLVLFEDFYKKNLKFLKWFGVVYLFTLLIEIIGVNTGLVFGKYEYGVVLGPMIFGTPLIIGFNWVIVILGAILIAQKITSNKILAIFISAFLAVFFDFLLEPVAINLKYWDWFGPVPMQNYAAWFIISLIGSASFIYSEIQTFSSLSKQYYIIQCVFFLTLNLGLK